MLLPQEIIRKKRDNQKLNQEEIAYFVNGITKGYVSEGQIAAFAMATYFRGMSKDEKINLTLSMRDSGDVLKWDLNGPIVDKHSTGGVGDVVSLMLGPLSAACGCYVPMISGRGLGHTGGTLDKFDSIPGYNTTPDNELFKRVVKDVGVAIIGQTANLAPADKRFYAIRDVTATVESIPLITASILSKKLSAGLEGLCMDVKAGSGAFMPTYEKSVELAKSIVDVANSAGCKTTAVITDMSQVLASSAGNALEVKEAVEYLKGSYKSGGRLHDVTMALTAEMLIISKIATDKKRAYSMLQRALESGEALDRFAKMIYALGGPVDFVDRYESYLETAPIIKPIYATQNGYINQIDTRGIGMAVVALKGGRVKPTDSIDYATGFSQIVSIGDRVDSSTPLALVHCRDNSQYLEAAKRLQEAVIIGDTKPDIPPAIYEYITPKDI